MDTTNKHIGNLLWAMSDKDLHEVLIQYIEKKFRETNKDLITTYEDMVNMELLYLKEVILCENFDYYGNIMIDYREDS